MLFGMPPRELANANPPNPWHTSHVEWIDAPPPQDLLVFEEHAKTVLSENNSPDLGFRWSLNPYRGCMHACSYCGLGDWQILRADGSVTRLDALCAGDGIYGTDSSTGVRRLRKTSVLAHWKTEKLAWRVTLADGSKLVASGDHRFLTRRGWKYVNGSSSGPEERPFLTSSDELVGLGTTPHGERHIVGALHRITSVDPTGELLPMFDITTGTGDFIANGVVSHNCYARPTHQYWDFGAGTDFERKIIAKVNAPAVLREQFMKRSWKGELVVFSGNTDCYQPLEASYELTRGCLEVMREFRNPIGMITKGALVRRDIDILQDLARVARVRVNISLAWADEDMARKMEPGAPSPAVRLKAMRALADAGIPVGVGIAPIIPGMNDSQVAEILTRARDAGATKAFRVMLRLPSEVKPVFLGRLQQEFPDRAKKVENAVREMRGGELYVSEFGKRGVGEGARWDAIERLFDLTCKKLGLDAGREDRMGDDQDDRATTFRRPGDQLRLF